jgi:DNA modification methylase
MSKSSLRDLRIEQVSLADLKFDPRNPRVHSDSQIAQIARSIEAFGFNVPIAVDADYKVLAGHGRLLAAQKLGWKAVPAIRLTHLTSAQARAFAIADNRLTENSTWNDKLLGEIFQDLASLDLDFDLEATGFTVGEIDLRIGEATAHPNSDSDPADSQPEVTDGPPVSNSGDLWILGKHRLLCGDSTDPTSYSAVMQGSHASVVFTDPPYNVPIDGHATGNGNVRYGEFAMASGEMTSAQFTYFLQTVLQLLARHSVRGSLHFICIDWRHQLELLTAGNQVYSELKNLCVWVKSNAGMGSLYRSQHELIFVFKHGKSPHRNNIQLGSYGRNRTNVWNYPSISAFGRKGEEGNLQALHPTVKPVAMVADAILDCTARGDIVLDSFLGSGTTLIAAERTGRVCRAIEISAQYVDTAIRRWQKHCGDHAVHALSGKRFDEIAAEQSEEQHG